MSRLALVTGGTRGIGAAIARLLKAEGYRVAANYCSNDEAAEAFYRDTDIPVFKFDVSDYDACAQGIQAVEAQLGPVDILIANAGVTRDGAFHRMSYDQWSKVVRTNLDSVFNCTRPVIEGMRERGFGRIGAFGFVGHAGDGALGPLGGRCDQEGAGDLMRLQMLGGMGDGGQQCGQQQARQEAKDRFHRKGRRGRGRGRQLHRHAAGCSISNTWRR